MSGRRKLLSVMAAGAMLATLTACGQASDTYNTAATETHTSSVAASEQAEPDTSGAASETYDSTVTYSEDTTIDGASYTSAGTDENAIVVESGTVTLDNITVTRESADSTGGDDASFYGVGAAVLSKGGTTNINNASITTDAKGGAGVFAYGDGIVHISDSAIATPQDTSGGIHVAGGGTLYATNVTATTEGESSAAVRSDRGGGLMVVDGGDYTSNGTGSPAIYCTATIAAKNADFNATSSEAVCIEGLNSLYLYDCDIAGNMHDLDINNDTTWNVILYQSMSGDSKVGNSTFQMSGGSLTARNGGMFYTTNTESTFILNDVKIQYADDSEFFLRCTGNDNGRGWGSTGNNGADCHFTAIDQHMEGRIIWDSISQLDFYMTDGSTLTGAVLQDESTAGDGGNGYANLNIGEGCEWVVTMDSTLSALHNAGSIVDSEGNAVTIVDMDGTVYEAGTGKYTVVVDSYDTEPDMSEARTITTYEDAQVNTGSETTGTPGGGPGEGGTPPEMPDGAAPGDGQQPPERPSGDIGNGQQPPERPSGDIGNGQQPPERPSGNTENGQQPPEPPNGGGQQPSDIPQ